jgi:hypothetical protein
MIKTQAVCRLRRVAVGVLACSAAFQDVHDGRHPSPVLDQRSARSLRM